MPGSEMDFAYKYPFSKEAKSIIERLQITKVDPKFLNASKGHIDLAIEEGIEYKNTMMQDVKKGYLITYAYSRMLLSVPKNIELISRYAAAEAKRSAAALSASGNEEIIALGEELGIKIKNAADFGYGAAKEELTISFQNFLKHASKMKGIELANQRLCDGNVMLAQNMALKLLEGAIRNEIMKGLPIPVNLLPKEVIEFSKEAKFKIVQHTGPKATGKADIWIEKLLQTPIADIRHRTVNLILAPYLVNTKGMGVDQAVKVICDYIERCKLLDPATRVNERYIRYQCDYAKKRNLKPLSLSRAKELLGGTVDTDTLI